MYVNPKRISKKKIKKVQTCFRNFFNNNDSNFVFFFLIVKYDLLSSRNLKQFTFARTVLCSSLVFFLFYLQNFFVLFTIIYLPNIFYLHKRMHLREKKMQSKIKLSHFISIPPCPVFYIYIIHVSIAAHPAGL